MQIANIAWLALVAWIASYIWTSYTSFKLHVAEAEKSGLPYIKAPFYSFQRLWLILNRPFMKILSRSLPDKWLGLWKIVGSPDWIWTAARQPYATLGSDTFLVVSPGRTQLYTSDPEVLTQITSRRADFPKPLELYKAIAVYGPNLVSSEGTTWRLHRRITAPPFNEKNNRLVWTESIHQAQQMLVYWDDETDNGKKTLHTLADDCMKVALHVISRAGFGIPLLWPHEKEDASQPNVFGVSSSTIPAGHTMSFRDALSNVLHSLIAIIVFPKWFLRIMPLKQTKLAYESYIEWGKYLREIVLTKKQELREGKVVEGFDLAGAFVRSAEADEAEEKEELGPIADVEKSVANRKLLSDEELIGNLFVMLLAGHETTANTLHFSMMFLAMNTKSQRNFQKDLESIFGSRDPSTWSYDTDAPKLFGGMTGAVMNEELRMIPPATGVPKSTMKGYPQPINVKGRKCVVPENTAITLDLVGAHRNSHYWPTLTPGAGPSDPNNDLNNFRPERWLLSEPGTGSKAAALKEDQDFTGAADGDVSASHLRPPKGAFAPFSDGARSCLGRRFAQVEALAILAVIFREYSVELALDDFASEEELSRMTRAQQKEIWNKAADRVRHFLQTRMVTAITIQLRGCHIPFRVVKKGQEKYFFHED